MGRFSRRSDRVPQQSNQPTTPSVRLLLAMALLLPFNAPAQAASVTGTLQVTVNVVRSCLVTTGSLAGSPTGTQGRLNCPTSSASSTSTPTAAVDPYANVSIADVPGTDGTVKIATFNF